jgi:hypothetical protein
MSQILNVTIFLAGYYYLRLMNKSPDFIAELKYRITEEGGRKTPVFKTGYRPQVKFPFSICKPVDNKPFWTRILFIREIQLQPK